jgi:hypothetical protein
MSSTTASMISHNPPVYSPVGSVTDATLRYNTTHNSSKHGNVGLMEIREAGVPEYQPRRQHPLLAQRELNKSRREERRVSGTMDTLEPEFDAAGTQASRVVRQSGYHQAAATQMRPRMTETFDKSLNLAGANGNIAPAIAFRTMNEDKSIEFLHSPAPLADSKLAKWHGKDSSYTQYHANTAMSLPITRDNGFTIDANSMMATSFGLDCRKERAVQDLNRIDSSCWQQSRLENANTSNGRTRQCGGNIDMLAPALVRREPHWLGHARQTGAGDGRVKQARMGGKNAGSISRKKFTQNADVAATFAGWGDGKTK